MIRGHVPAHTSLTQVTAGTRQVSHAGTTVRSAARTALIHSKVNAGGHVIVGAVLSSTVISCVHVAVFKQLSVAIYVRVMIRGHVPAHTSLTQVTAGTPQLSLAVTNVISGAGTALIHSKVNAGGHVIVGAVLSSTVISCVHVAVFKQLSVAIYVRVMIRGHVPAHTSLTQVTTGTPQLSLAVTNVLSGAGTARIQSTFPAGGPAIVGAVLSSTVI